MPPPKHELSRAVAKLIGSRIRELRQARKWSANQLATKSTIPHSTLSGMEGGRASAITLPRLLLLVDTFELASFEEILGGSLGTTTIRSLGSPPVIRRT